MWSLSLVLIWGLVIAYLPDLNSFYIQSLMGELILFSYLAWFLKNKIHWSIGLAYFYFSLHSVRLMNFPQVYWENFDIASTVGFECLVTSAQLYMTIIALTFALLKNWEVKKVRELLCYFAILNLTVCMYRYLFKTMPYFLFNNESLDTSFSFVIAPMVYEFIRKNYSKFFSYLYLITLVTVGFLSYTASGVGGFIISLTAYFWAKHGFKLKPILYAGVIGIFAGGFGLWMQTADQLFNSSGRMGIWKLALKYWSGYVNAFTGTGLGTFQMYGPALQANDAIAKHQDMTVIPGFFWAHNDWLQILFESGLIGLFITALVYGIALWRSRLNPALFSGLVTFGALALIQMPLRHILFTILGAFYLLQAFKYSEQEIIC